jgi:hypothetical protein
VPPRCWTLPHHPPGRRRTRHLRRPDHRTRSPRRPPALKLGGRGQWRIERSKLEAFIRKRDGQWEGNVRYTTGLAETRIGWLAEDRIRGRQEASPAEDG